MTSKRQLEANRANAKYSTGPKSQKGKARSRLNAVTHGLTAKQIVVAGEKPEEFDGFRERLFANFNATLERELVDLLAGLLWRLRRVPVVESGLLKDLMHRDSLGDGLKRLTDEEFDQFEALYLKVANIGAEPNLTDLADNQGSSEGSNGGQPRNVEMLTIFTRYQSNLMNDVIKTLKLLHACHAARAAANENTRTVDAHDIIPGV
jgi:hypothetical protein